MQPTQWAELELELGQSDYAESGSEYSGSGSDASSGSDAESRSHGSPMKILLVVGGTLALALVVVVGFVGSNTLPAFPQSSSAPSTAQTLLIAKPAPSKARETLTIRSSPAKDTDGVPLKADAYASPQAPQPLAMAQLAVNRRHRPTSLKPEENMHDGNTCDETEELYAGLCYTKCSILTGFKDARRSTAFSCCPTSDCHGNVFRMQTVSLIPCQGYDVSSSDKGKACPHIRGECLEDEEQFMGECFEKCSLLTDGKFPHRIAAASCCNPEGTGGCWNFGNDDTNAKLNVGGGKGDGDASTPRASHFPLKYLTEKN